jgi:signal transduction histidine kinase
MSLMPASSQIANAQVDAEGRLVQADAPIMQLQSLAGGQAGGLLVVPGLAKIAAATHNVKMKMARAIRVAGDNEDVELWVETQLIDNIAHLKVTGWRKQDISEHTNTKHLDVTDGAVRLVLDSNLRIISEAGLPAEIVSGDIIGKGMPSLFPRNMGANNEFLQQLEKQLDFEFDQVSALDGNTVYNAKAHRQSRIDGSFSGYFVTLTSNLTETRNQSEKSERAESLFGHHLGSALRQPLGRIIANAETIGNKLQGPIRENYAVYAKDIADAARHLVALVDDIGDLEVVEREGFVTAKDKIELGDIARRVAGLLALKAGERDIQIITPDENNLVPAIAEFRRVLQIVINLVTNAIRYSNAGTKITIVVEKQENSAVLLVIDQGKGIAAEDQNKVFEKFERLGRSGDGGSGLGLYISRKLALAMGGDLSVTNAASGGAEFTLRLPSM